MARAVSILGACVFVAAAQPVARFLSPMSNEIVWADLRVAYELDGNAA